MNFDKNIDTLLAELARLEEESSGLEPTADERKAWANEVIQYSENFLGGLPDQLAFNADEGRGEQFKAELGEQPARLQGLLSTLAEYIDDSQLNPASAGYMAYIPGGGLYPSALGDFLAAVSNRYSGVSYAAPGAVKLEFELVRWMCDLVGYPDSAGGDLTSGGSMASLGAMVTAREAAGLGGESIGNACIYLTRQTHHCVAKALRIAGMGDAKLRFVPMDPLYRMNPVELSGMIEADQSIGLNPFMVIGTAGTTDTGAVDPLMELAKISQEFGLWYHIDAAYGGFFLLTTNGKEVLQGLSEADSIVMDPHKGLFLPFGSGALLVKDVELLASAFSFEADYMQDVRQPGQLRSPSELSCELTRPFRGLRIWMALKMYGLNVFRAALKEKLLLAKYFHSQLASVNGWEPGPEPDLSVVVFRFIPHQGDVDDFNRKLLELIRSDGRVILSSTQIDDRFTLRLAVLSFRTHRKHIDLLLSLLAEKVKELQNEHT